jgi:hypothetical protein
MISDYAEVSWPLLKLASFTTENRHMPVSPQISPAKRKRMLKAHWPRPSGYAQDNLECMNKNLVLRKETMQLFFVIAARKRHQAKERRSVRRLLLRLDLQARTEARGEAVFGLSKKRIPSKSGSCK